jgi:dTDP-4-amino-4,6-dideoxygalactose transaminase
MRERYCYEIPGHNYRLTDLQAAIAIPQLRRLSDGIERRSANAALLDQALDALPGLVRPTAPAGRTHVWHQYTVRITSDARLRRDDLARELAARGIETGIYYPHVVFDHACYRDHPQVRCAEVPNARAAASEVLSLPVHSGLSEGDVAAIGDAVRELLAC